MILGLLSWGFPGGFMSTGLWPTPYPQKEVGHFYFCDNFGKSGPVFIIFHC